MKARSIQAAKRLGAKWKKLSPELHVSSGFFYMGGAMGGVAAIGTLLNKHSRKKHPKSAKAYDKMKAGTMTHEQVIKVMKKEGAI